MAGEREMKLASIKASALLLPNIYNKREEEIELAALWTGLLGYGQLSLWQGIATSDTSLLIRDYTTF